MIADDAMAGGFADPVFQSQAVFRKVLTAFSRPGTIVDIPAVVEPPHPLLMPAAAFIAAFADEGTPVYVDATIARAEATVSWIRFHTDAPIAASPATAAFALVADVAAMPPLDAFALGSAEYPDRSTTVVIQVERVSRETVYTMEGPGIDGTADLGAHPVPADFVDQFQANRRLYPRGVDLVLASPVAIVALPRSVRVSNDRTS